MAFRPKTIALEWKAWLEKHQDALLKCGIPFLVVENWKAWSYFLDHGYFSPEGINEPIINVDSIEMRRS